jgi:hypothetical protein
MTLYEKIIAIYPELVTYNFANKDIILQDDGQGAYIKSWNHPTLTRPTQTQLDEVTE